MTPDPYDHVREAFHTVADGLMGWNDPPDKQPDIDEDAPAWLPTDHPDYSEEERQELERCREGEPCARPAECIPLGFCRYGAVRSSKPLGAQYAVEDLSVLENAGESLIRAGCYSEAVALFALALRVRMELQP